MGARRGQNNFKAAQREKVNRGKLLVEHALGKINKRRIFSTVGQLLVEVAEKTAMHRTTLQRNKEYFRLVLTRFSKQPGAAEQISDDDADATILRIKLIAERVKSGNLEKELKKLKQSSEYLLNEGGSIDHPLFRESMNENEKTTRRPADIAFACTAMSLLLLLERLEKMDIGVALDYQQKLIIDASEVGTKRVIAGPDRTRWFFDWLATHQALTSLQPKSESVEN